MRGWHIVCFNVLAWVVAPGAFADTDRLIEGHRAMTEWQLEEALSIAESLMAEDPSVPDHWALAARVLHARGAHEEAARLIESAMAQGVPHVFGVEERAAPTAAFATHFQEIRTPHFSIRYLNKDEIVATYAHDILEAAFTRTGAALGFESQPGDDPIVVEIYPNVRGLAAATGLTVEEIRTSGTIAVCKFHRLMITSPLAAANGYRWGQTLAHEFIHLVISKESRNNVPIWLHEGIAKYYESTWDGPPGRALSPYSENLLAQAVQKGDLITFEEMHPSMAKLPSQEAAALAFAEVFTVIEYVNKAFGKKAVPNLLDELGRGTSLEKALKRGLGTGLAGLQKKWKRYLKRRKFRRVAGAEPQRLTLAGNEKDAQSPESLKEIKDTDAYNYGRLGELLQLRGHNRAAVIEYERAYKRVGARYPTLVNRMARAYTTLKEFPRARTLVSSMLKIHPENADGHLMAGRLAFLDKDLNAAEKHMKTVTLRNPFNPEVHQALASLYEEKGQLSQSAMEKRFITLTSKTRPSRKYERRSLPPKAAVLSLATVPFATVTLPAERITMMTPAWGLPVPVGMVEIQIEYRDGTGRQESVEVRAGEDRLVTF